jgi:deoxycytidine triphosphate deaminase
MSVVPLKLGESVVDTQDKFQKGGGFEGKALLVFNLDSRQLSGSSSNVSYDLRVGSEYRGHRDPEKTEIPEEGYIILRPGNAVLIQSEEVVFLPRNMFGYVVPKVTLLQKGISNTLSKVDPGYNGPLIVTLFNLGKTDQRLNRRDPFCALVLHTVSDGASLYNKAGKRITGNPREPWWPSLKDWLEANKTWLNLLVALFSGGLAGAVITLISRASGGSTR